MRTVAKVFAWLIGIIVLLYIILALVLHYAIDTKTYKSFVENAVYKFTGHKMVIRGQFKWRVFPNPTIKVGDVLIDNQKGTQHISPYFAKINEADLQISLLPLFSGNIVVKKIVLKNAHLNLIYQSAKHNTFTVANVTQSKQNTSTTNQQKDNQPSQIAELRHLQLPNVTILNSSVNWIDLKDNKITNFKDINVMIHPQQNSALIKGGLTIVQGKQTLTLQLSTQLNNNEEYTQFSLQQLTVRGSVSNNGKLNSLNYEGPITIDLNKQTLSIPSYQLSWNKLPMSGKIDANWKTDNTGFYAEFSASTQVADGLINEKGRFNAPNDSDNNVHYLLSIHHIQLEPVLDSFHYNNLLKGTGSLTATLSASNKNQHWLANLNGNGNFKLTNTQLGTINVSNYLNQALKLAHQKTVEDSGITIFSTISGSFNIRNGVFYNNDLAMQAKNVTATGSGNINFTNQAINYHITINPAKVNFTVPLKISGDLHRPKITVDFADLSKNVLKKTFNKKNVKHFFDDVHHNLKEIF